MQEIRKIIIILIILNVVIFSSYFYLFMDIKQAERDISLKLSQIKLETQREERLRSIKNLMNETKNQREKIANFFVQSDGSVEFMETVESLGEITGVKLEIESVGIDSSKNKTGSSTESFRLSVKAEGLWANVIHLLSMLENMPFKVSFDNVALNKISGESNSVKNKERSSSYWSGNFGFSVLKIKNLPQSLKK